MTTLATMTISLSLTRQICPGGALDRDSLLSSHGKSVMTLLRCHLNSLSQIGILAEATGSLLHEGLGTDRLDRFVLHVMHISPGYPLSNLSIKVGTFFIP